MKKSLSLLFLLISISPLFAQSPKSPYQTDFWTDGSLITGEVALNVLGVVLIQNKDDLSPAEAYTLDKNDLAGINRPVAGNYSQQADEASYIPFYASFASPLLLLLGENERKNYGPIMVLFLETMAMTGALYANTAGLVDKSRPLVYNKQLRMEERTEAGAQRSFFAGHTAATAAATFFTAKVFQDFHPNSSAIPFVWAGAVALPGFVGYLRMEAGKHFLTDNIIGFGVGALSGILIPELHKIGNDKVDVYPAIDSNVNGTGISSTGIGFNFSF